MLLVLLCSPVSARAQPVLGANAFPEQGSIYGYHDVPYLPAGRGGEGMLWNFGDLPLGALVPYQWIATDIAPGASSFPKQALVLQVPGEPTAYYLRGDTALYWLGTYSDTALVRSDPPMVVLRVPCSMSSRWQDTAVYVATGAGRIDVRSATLEARADGWGTLTMPYGSMNNILRVRSELNVVSRNDPEQVILREVRHTWYSDRTPMPVLEITERHGWSMPEGTVRWLDGSWQDDPSSLFQPIVLHAFPTPFTNIVTVDLPAAQADHTVLQLVDASGQLRKEWPVEFTSPETRRLILEVGEVPGGQYTLTWRGTHGTLGNVRLQKE
jgi:hypothetical protein